ncbi:MAG TPA: hypothetical protein VL326_01305 [Kofleriaceae bacterium]|jgi:hypothetical protein|nr:hypothetical protein [Kofleriaceae bacterium]
MRRWTIAIFVAVFGMYMLVSSREPAWGDAHSMWEVADVLVEHGKIDIKTRWPEDIPPGRDGKIYSINPIGVSLVHVPGAAGAAVSHRWWPDKDGLLRPIFTHIGPAAMGALACVMFFLLLVDLGRSKRTASLCTAILALATTTFVYARMPYSEVLQLALFMGLFRQSLKISSEPTRKEALWWGVWAGALFNAKYVFGLAIVGAVLLVGWTLRARRSELLRIAGWAAVTGGPLLVLALVYNYLRWGSITATGYGPYLSAFFGGSVFDGAWGMLASPNKSAFLYSPPLLLALLGWPAAIREHRRLGLALLLIVLPTFLVYCTYRSWSGDYAWGPRFFVWTVPVLLVGIGWFIDRGPGRMSRWKRAFVGLVVACGIAVQLLGSALYWDHFIRIAIDVKNQWLGNPNRSGSYIAERGRGHCDSCFEDTYEIMWTPAFQPIAGHWWLVKSLARGDEDWHVAQQDAPWRTYTHLEMNLGATYPRARIDWWGLLWIKDAPKTRPLGIFLLLLFAGGTGFGIWRWIRLHRSGNQETDAAGSAGPSS